MSETAPETPPAPPAAATATPPAPAPSASPPPPTPVPPASPAPPAAPAPVPPQPPAAGPATPAPSPASQPALPATADGTDWKAEAEKWKRQARANEERSKANHEEVKQLDSVLRLVAEKVGVEFDTTPDPAKLTERLNEAQAQARQRAIELAVYRSAAAAGADPDALLDSRAFAERSAQLDLSAADFTTRVRELVAEVAQENPRYQAAPPPAPAAPPATPPAAVGGETPPAQPPPPPPPPAASGANFAAPGENRLWTQADYDYWVKHDRDGSVVSKAIEDGLLAGLGIGKPKRKTRR